MFKRTSSAAAIVLSMALALALAGGAWAASAKPAMSADQALGKLQAGNVRFATDKPERPRCDLPRRTVTATEGQQPFATILACSDSRVPPEILFDQGIGDLFVVRVAGNVADVHEIGTMEYGVDHLGTPLLVVLGHSKCGAVTAVVQGAEVHGNIAALVSKIAPAAARAKADNPDAQGEALVNAAIQDNVWQAIHDLLAKSPVLRERLRKGDVKIVGALYDLAGGTVAWLGPHPQQDTLLAAPAAAPAKAKAPAGTGKK